MKEVKLLAALMLIASLAGCRAKKAIIYESSAVARVDTTKTVADSLTATQAVTNAETASFAAAREATGNTKSRSQSEESAVIYFVDNGGMVSIDTAGNVTLTGVKSIMGRYKAASSRDKEFAKADTETFAGAKETAKNEKITNAHSKQINGISTNEQKQSRQERETTETRPKWHQAVLAKIGGLCCIATLLWLLFLYLKRKF